MPEPPHDSEPDSEGAPATESFTERMSRLDAERREAYEREADNRERRAQMWRAEMAERRRNVAADPITNSDIGRDKRIDNEVRRVIYDVGVELGHESHRGFMPSLYGAGIPIGSILSTAEREAAYVQVRAKLKVAPTPTLTLTRGNEGQRLRDFDRRPYLRHVYPSEVSPALAVVESRRPARRGRSGELLDATVVVIPDGAFRKKRAAWGSIRVVPSAGLKEWLDRALAPMRRPELPPPPPADPDPFGTLMRSVGVHLPSDPESPNATPPPGAPGSPVWDPEIHGDTPPRTGFEAPGDEPPDSARRT
jgi:hypothetical protein